MIFFSAFLAATLLPFYSEVLVIAQLLKKPEAWFLIWLVASVGNTLGAAVNWLIGRYLLHYQDRRWFPFKQKQLYKAQHWFQKYGVWSLLMAWAPVGGDALTFIAGLMKVRFWIFFLLTFMGKAIRYAVVVYLTIITLS
ncbi:YqaA family protein [Spartinivicinus ruber]|uniref:YqaA family protein n=1 Tax=Spartinivicinus ruber TaxID=2683272 RepID=UPI001E29A595|nr:YqaA family protein [Spartinivicinus ruber]